MLKSRMISNQTLESLKIAKRTTKPHDDKIYEDLNGSCTVSRAERKAYTVGSRAALDWARSLAAHVQDDTFVDVAQ